jgi:hypothetical protein
VCGLCEPYEAQDQLINRLVTTDKRQRLVQQAQLLLTGNAVPREAGEVILRSTLDHVTSDWKRNDFAQKYAGYAWYYFCDEGVYGSKFPAAALQILQSLLLASGNGLVEMVTWLTGYTKVEDCERYGDFYHRCQVKGESLTPSLTESGLQNLVLAVKLRGSEADRIGALEQYRILVERLGSDADQLRTVTDILGSDAQDYEAALAKMQEVEEKCAAQPSGFFGGLATVTYENPGRQHSKKKGKHSPSSQRPQQPTPVDEAVSKEEGLQDLLKKWGNPRKK